MSRLFSIKAVPLLLLAVITAIALVLPLSSASVESEYDLLSVNDAGYQVLIKSVSDKKAETTMPGITKVVTNKNISNIDSLHADKNYVLNRSGGTAYNQIIKRSGFIHRTHYGVALDKPRKVLNRLKHKKRYS